MQVSTISLSGFWWFSSYFAIPGCKLQYIWCNTRYLDFIICSLHQHPNLEHKHQLLEEKRHRWKAHPILLPEQRFPSLSHPFTSNLPNRSFQPFLCRIARLRGLLICEHDRSGSYRETRAKRGWERWWPHHRREAERTAATLDELLIWTNREAVGREHGQQQTLSSRGFLLLTDSFYFYRP